MMVRLSAWRSAGIQCAIFQIKAHPGGRPAQETANRQATIQIVRAIIADLRLLQAGPNTRTTFVFINMETTRPSTKVDAGVAVVSDGMEVVDKLYNGYGEGVLGHGADRWPDYQMRNILERAFPS